MRLDFGSESMTGWWIFYFQVVKQIQKKQQKFFQKNDQIQTIKPSKKEGNSVQQASRLQAVFFSRAAGTAGHAPLDLPPEV